MNIKQRVYAILLSLAALYALADCAYGARLTLLHPRGVQDYVLWGFFFLLFIAVRSLALPLRGDGELSLSFSVALCATLMTGNEIAILLYALATPFCFFPNPTDRRLHSALYYPPLRVFFNTALMILSLYAARFAMPQPLSLLQDFVFPDSLLPLLIFGLVALVVTFLGTAVLQALEKGPGIARRPGTELSSILLGLPVGFLMALLLRQPGQVGTLPVPASMLLLILLLIPLPFLRHALAIRLENGQAFLSLMEDISDRLEADDPYLQGHSRRVRDISRRIAYSMGFPSSRIEELDAAALLHDIGKACIDENILNKKGSLTPEESKEVQAHSTLGAQMLEALPVSSTVVEVLRSHHERYDGMGYPQGIRLSDLPAEVSIVSVAEAFDAMTSERPFRKAMSQERALSVLIEESGRQFSPEVVYALQQGALDPEEQ